MEFQKIVEELTGKIKHTWFTNKKKDYEIKKNQLLESLNEKLLNNFSNTSKEVYAKSDYHSIKDFEYFKSQLKNKLDIESDELFSIISFSSLERFCWIDDTQIIIHENLEFDLELSETDAMKWVTDFCLCLSSKLPSSDVKTSFNLIDRSIQMIEEQISETSNASEDIDFKSVCQYLIKKARRTIWNHFSLLHDQYIYGSDSNEKLEFDLNKQQLVSLIFLIIESKMLANDNATISGKYDFFETYFYWTNSSTDKRYPLNEIRKIISKIKNGEKYNAMDEVMGMLKDAYNKILT